MPRWISTWPPSGKPKGPSRATTATAPAARLVLTGSGKLELQVPRDRQASFEPQLIAKYRRPFPDFDDKIGSLYARGMTTREIQGLLRELYGIDTLQQGNLCQRRRRLQRLSGRRI